MSSNRFRSMCLPRFSKADVQTILASKSRRRTAVTAGAKNYETLESRQLLTADIGLNFTSVNGGSAFTSNGNPPNISAAVGESHVVQFLNDGYGIFAREDGALVENGSLEQFFSAAGADLGGAELTQPRLVFDSGFDRWYVIAVDNQDLNDDLPLLQGNRIFVAASSSPDPTDPWDSFSIQPDEGSLDEDGNLEFLAGTERINLTVDEVGLTISAQEFNIDPEEGKVSAGTAVYGLPQVALFGGSIETDRLESSRGNDNDPDNGGFGVEVQFGYDTTTDPQSFPVTSRRSAFGLAIDGDPAGTADENGNTFPFGREGDEIILTEITRDGIPNVDLNLQVGEVTRIPIPFFREPDVVRQPTDIIRDRDSTLFNASVMQEGQYLYAVHSVRGGADNFGANAVLRWYVVDTLAENPEDLLVDSGQIEAATDDLDFIDPSIDVSPNGTVAIGYTATGLSVNPSSYTSVGVPIAGIGSNIVFNDPTPLRVGESHYINDGDQFFGRYSTTTADPYNENRFWTFQQFVDANNNWAIQTTEFGLSDANPSLEVLPENTDNLIEIQQVGVNIEVSVDGVLVGQYDSSGIGTLTIDGNGGRDQFVVDIVDLNADEIAGTYILIGDGDDTLEVITDSDLSWAFDGSDGASVGVGGADRISASGMNEFRSGAGNDRFEFPTSNYEFPVHGGEGNDVFVVGQEVTGNLVLRGEAGDDTYSIAASSFGGVDFLDSLDAENDQLVAAGSDGADIITIGDNSITINGFVVPFEESPTEFGIESFAVDALADNDIFNIMSTTQDVLLLGHRGDDTFNVMETSQMMGVAELVIDGGEDVNTLNVFQNDALDPVTVTADVDLITGMSSAAVRFTASGGGSFLEILHGSETRGDVFEIVNVATENNLQVMGRAADDLFIFENLVDGTVELIGGDGDDRFETNVTSVFDVVITDSVDAEADVLYVSLTELDDTIEVGEGGYVFNGVAYPTTDAMFSGIEDFSIDALDGNDNFIVTRTTTPASLHGGAGDDTYTISDATVTTGFDSLVIDGGSGDNQMFVSRSAILGGAEAGTEIQVEDNQVVGMTIAPINYTATDGLFSVIELQGSNGVDGDDLDDIFRINTLGEETLLRVDGLGGDDLIHVRAVAEGDVEATGGEGDDSYIVALGGEVDRNVLVTDTGDAGDDRLDVFFSDDDQVIEVLDDNPGGFLDFSIDTSRVEYDPTLETLALHALGGNDRYVVTETTTANLIMAGGDGDDTYDIENVFGSTMVSIIDSVDAENDRLLVSGTTGDDVFDIGENSFLINGNVFIGDTTDTNVVGVESIEIDALDGDDTFNVSSATRGFRLLGGTGADRFVINDTAADAGFNVLEIDGGEGINTMDIQRVEGLPRFAAINATTIDNVAKARISYTATGGSFDGGDGGITIRGLETADSFLVFGMLETNSLQLHGNGGNDYHRIETSVAGDVWMDGGTGTDRYVLFLDENKSRSLRIADSGTDTAARDRINFFLTENSDEVTLAGNSLSVMGDTASFDPTIETVEILAGEGDDEIDLQSFSGVTFLRIKGQSGDDRLDVNGAAGVQNVFLIGDDGDDRFNLQSSADGSYVSAAGNAGEDSITVAEDFYANSLINGGEGDDDYDVSFADQGDRLLRISDSGVDGNDTAIVRGTMAASQLTLRASGITSPTQLIGTTRRLESLELIGTSDRDLVTMFAVPVTNMSVNTLTGADILEVNSNNGAENLVFDLGAERDVANIRTTAAGSQTTLIMGRDDDMVNIGSTFAQDNGNLDAIRGELTIDLGQGSDRLQVNDVNSAGTHGYTLSDTRIENRDSVAVRPNFAGITHSGAEFVNLKGNVQVNTFVVTPSPTVRFLFDGNAPNVNRLTITGSEDGRELVELDEFAGIWLFDSFRDVQFERFINV